MKMSDDKQLKSVERREAGRLAFREEGPLWVAYWAETGTMDGAVVLGSIAMRFVLSNQERKKAFMEMMKGAMTDLLVELHMVPMDWETHAAPERERGE